MRRFRIPVLLGMAGIFGLVIFLIVSRLMRSEPDEPLQPEPPALLSLGEPSLTFANRAVAKEMAISVGLKNRATLAVRFATSFITLTAHDGTKSSLGITRMSGPDVFVDGEFTLVEIIHGNPPAMGKIETKVTPVHRGGPSINALAYCHFSTDPALFLAAGADPTKPITSAQFFGPISEADVACIKDLVKALHKEGYDDMPQESAREFLPDRRNPLKIWIGLARIEDLRCLGFPEWNQALELLPPNQSPRVVQEMVLASIFNEDFRNRLAEAWLTEKHGPEKLEQILTAIRGSMVMSAYKQGRMPRDQLLARARELRNSTMDKPEYKAVVSLLDGLLSTKW